MGLWAKDNTDFYLPDAQTAYIGSNDLNRWRQKLIPTLESMLVLSFKLVFRATLIARHLNY